MIDIKSFKLQPKLCNDKRKKGGDASDASPQPSSVAWHCSPGYLPNALHRNVTILAQVQCCPARKDVLTPVVTLFM